MRFAARLLLAVALLLAQQVALAHQVWHFGKDDSQPAQSQLCEHHASLATVAGALDCAAADTPNVTTVDRLLVVAARAVATAPVLFPSSRGPPAIAPTLN